MSEKMESTQSIIGKAATTGVVSCEIGTISCNSSGKRVVWKLNGKQMAFNALYAKLEERAGSKA